MMLSSESGPHLRCLRSVTLLVPVLAAVWLFPSCATIPGVKKISVPSGQRSVEGESVNGLARAIDVAADKGGALHLFLVHGMSNHPFGDVEAISPEIRSYADLIPRIEDKTWRDAHHERLLGLAAKEQFGTLVSRTSRGLGLKQVGEVTMSWLSDSKGITGYQLRSVYEGESAKGRKRKLVIHRNCWAFTVVPFKSELQRVDDDPARNPYWINKAIKDGMVTWGLMDAALYSGNQRKRMQDAVAMGLQRVGKEDLENGKFAFGAASLGSIITLDTMSRDAGRLNPELTAAFFSGEQPLYFFANQVALLGPAGADPLRKGNKARESMGMEPGLTSSLREFAESVPKKTTVRGPAKLTVVAFNDPADLLGYPVPAVEDSTVRFRIVNVSVRNQAVGIWFAAVNPLDAHTGFPKTKDVVKIMTDGIDRLPAPPAVGGRGRQAGQPGGPTLPPAAPSLDGPGRSREPAEARNSPANPIAKKGTT